MSHSVGTTSGGKSSFIPRLSWPSDTTTTKNLTASASTRDEARTVIRPQLLGKLWASSASQTSLGKSSSLGTFDCAPSRMTLSSLFHSSLPLGQSKQAVQPASTQRTPSPVVSLQGISRRQEYSFQEPQPSAHVCGFQAKQQVGVDGDEPSYAAPRKFKVRAAPVDFAEGRSPSASVHFRVASNCIEAPFRSSMMGIARNTSRGRKPAADPPISTASPRSNCLNQAFSASGEPAPLRLSLILPKSQQHQQPCVRRCSVSDRRNGRNESTNRLRSSFIQYERPTGEVAPPKAQAAHRKGSQRGLGLKHSLVPQNKHQEISKTAHRAAESHLSHGGCIASLHSCSDNITPQLLEKSNIRCLLKGEKSAVTQANVATNGQAALAGGGARLRVQKHKGKTMATAKHSPVVATGSAEADFHSPLVAECSLLQSSDCSSHVPCLLGEVPSSPSRERQPSLEPKPLPTPPVSSVQEKVEAGGHSERETATTAAATPPVSHAGVPPIAEKVRKTETHPGRSISNTSGRVEPNVVASSQKRVQPPQTPGFVGKVYQNCREPTSEYEDVEENTEALALLRHSEVSFVCVRALVSFLASCCTVSHFGSDERLQQANDLSTSPFHCSSRPHIGLEEYLVKRIFRHGKQTINEGVMAVALLSRFLCKQNALLSAALRENSHQQRLQQHLDSCSRDATVRDKDARHGSAIARATSATEGFSATAARIGYIEFNYLTAHRLLLTAAFLARKTHRDDHTSIRHWAQLGGVPVEDLVEAESAFVQVVEWRVQVTLDEFFSTALAISLGDPRLLGKQGELQPVRGNPATTAVYVREHALLLQQQADLTTPTTLRGLQAQEQLHQKTALDKMQLHQTEEVLTCYVAPPEGLASSQVENDVLNKSEPIGFPLSSTSKQFRETARYSLKTGSKVGPLDLPQSPSGDENLSTTDATQAPTMWKLSRALNQHECTARSTACAADDCSHSPSASVKPHDTSSCILQEDILQSKGRRHFKAYPLRTFKKEETKAPTAHTNLRAGLAPTQ